MSRIDFAEEEKLIRIAKSTRDNIVLLKQKYYKDVDEKVKALIITEMSKVEKYITSYKFKNYASRKFEVLSDSIKEISFKKLCDSINPKISFIIRCIKERYNYSISEDIRLWINKIKKSLQKLDIDECNKENLENELKVLEELKKSIYISKFILNNKNYSLVKEIFECSEYFVGLDDIDFAKQEYCVVLYIGLSIILEEFCKLLTILEDCEESLRNAILDYVSDMAMIENIIQIETKEN